MKNLLFKILLFSFLGLSVNDGFSQRYIWLQFEGPGNTRVQHVTIREVATNLILAYSSNTDFVILNQGQYLNQKLRIEASSYHSWELEILQDASLHGLKIYLVPSTTTDNPATTNRLTVNSIYTHSIEPPRLSERRPTGGSWSNYFRDEGRSNNSISVFTFNPQGSTESSIQIKEGVNALVHFNLQGIKDDAIVDVILENGVGPKKDKD